MFEPEKEIPLLIRARGSRRMPGSVGCRLVLSLVVRLLEEVAWKSMAWSMSSLTSKGEKRIIYSNAGHNNTRRPTFFFSRMHNFTKSLKFIQMCENIYGAHVPIFYIALFYNGKLKIPGWRAEKGQKSWCPVRTTKLFPKNYSDRGDHIFSYIIFLLHFFTY